MILLLKDHFSNLMFCQNRMAEWLLDSVDLDGWGFWWSAVDEDWFEDAVFQAIPRGKDVFVRGEVESDIVTEEPW